MTKFSKDGACIISIKDSNTLAKSIVRIESNQESQKRGTGFFAKIINENNKSELKFLVTNHHIITKDMVDNKNIIDIYFITMNNPEKELNRKIDLDENRRYIKCDSKHDFTIIQILKTDRIYDERFLSPDLDYKKGNEFYKGKICYLAGYPSSTKEEKIQEESISVGKIINYGKEFDFEHDIDTVNCSSGSPICLKDNLLLIGIHKGTNCKKKKNYGIFFEIIINNVNNEESLKKINLIKNKDDQLNLSDVEEENDMTEPLLQNLRKPKEKELLFLDRFILSIFFLSFMNLKLILISEENYQILEHPINKFFLIIICPSIALCSKNIFLIFLIVIEILLLISNIYSFFAFPESIFKDIYLYFIFEVSLLRVFKKDVLIWKLYQNDYYASMSLFTYTEILSNIASFTFIQIHRILSEITFKEVLLIINYLINLMMTYILYRNNDKLELILKKIKKENIEKNNINNENLCKRIFHNIFAIIYGISIVFTINETSLLPSSLYYNNKNDGLFTFIFYNFLGRNIYFLIKDSSLILKKIAFIISFLLYFVISQVFGFNFIELENLLIFGLYSFAYGVLISANFDFYDENCFRFYKYCILFLLFTKI